MRNALVNRERNKEKKRKIAFCILLMGVVPAAIGIPHFIRAKTVSSCVFSSHLALFRRLPCLMCVRSLPFRVAILRNRNPQKKKEVYQNKTSVKGMKEAR